jgi:hypothetical protein
MSHIFSNIKRPVSRQPTSPSTGQEFNSASEGQIAFLQHTIGNQAVQRLLISRSTDTALKPLSPSQTSKAVAYYPRRASQYTPEIIMQIQAEVGTKPTGRMAEEDVQAVARRQQQLNEDGAHPALKIDGMAGPRTLPTVFKFGMSQDDELGEYGQFAREQLAHREGVSDEEIAMKLIEQLNRQLNQQAIPPVIPVIGTQALGGGFNFTTWELIINPRLFKDDDQLHHLTISIYHEGRHAEQRFRVARLLAGRGRSAEQIHQETSIPTDIAELACENPLQLDTMEAVIAQHWYESMYGKEGIEQRNRNGAEIDAAFAEREAAKKANKEHPSPANQAREDAAKERYKRANAEHDDIPTEFDAERQEDRMLKLIGGKRPEG